MSLKFLFFFVCALFFESHALTHQTVESLKDARVLQERLRQADGILKVSQADSGNIQRELPKGGLFRPNQYNMRETPFDRKPPSEADLASEAFQVSLGELPEARSPSFAERFPDAVRKTEPRRQVQNLVNLPIPSMFRNVQNLPRVPSLELDSMLHSENSDTNQEMRFRERILPKRSVSEPPHEFNVNSVPENRNENQYKGPEMIDGRPSDMPPEFISKVEHLNVPSPNINHQVKNTNVLHRIPSRDLLRRPVFRTKTFGRMDNVNLQLIEEKSRMQALQNRNENTNYQRKDSYYSSSQIENIKKSKQLSDLRAPQMPDLPPPPIGIF